MVDGEHKGTMGEHGKAFRPTNLAEANERISLIIL